MLTRRIVLACVVLSVIGIAPALAGATGKGFTSQPQRHAAFTSGGLGLTIGSWEAIYGAGEQGQTYLTYYLGDGAYNVGFDGPRQKVFIIERVWDDPAGASLEAAQGEAQGLIPSDATFSEYYDAASAQILYGIDVDRFRSTSLTKQMRGTDRNLLGYFAVIYEKIPSQEGFGFNVTRMVLVVATKNPNIG